MRLTFIQTVDGGSVAVLRTDDQQKVCAALMLGWLRLATRCVCGVGVCAPILLVWRLSLILLLCRKVDLPKLGPCS